MRRIRAWLTHPEHRWLKMMIVLLFFGGVAYLLSRGVGLLRLVRDPRSQSFLQWSQGDAAECAELITTQRDACSGAPFILPTDGFIGLLYEDPRGPYSNSNPHQGLDIFSEGEPGTTPVYAA